MRSISQGSFRIVSRVNESTPWSSKSKLFLPIIPHRIPKPFYPSQDTGPPISADVELTDLASESTRRYAVRRTLNKRPQAIPDAINELGLSEDQYCNTVVFLWVTTDPCEPAEANCEEKYEIQPVTQFQIVQYETRRELLGTRCERHISQSTYYRRNADHASPLPQETFYWCLKVLAQNECRALEMGQYRAGDGKTYSIKRNVRMEINYFAGGSANADSGFHGNQITCTGGKLLVDGLEIDNMVMYVTEELLYHDEKFISREDDDGIIAQ